MHASRPPWGGRGGGGEEDRREGGGRGKRKKKKKRDERSTIHKLREIETKTKLEMAERRRESRFQRLFIFQKKKKKLGLAEVALLVGITSSFVLSISSGHYLGPKRIFFSLSLSLTLFFSFSVERPGLMQ